MVRLNAPRIGYTQGAPLKLELIMVLTPDLAEAVQQDRLMIDATLPRDNQDESQRQSE